MLSKKESCRQHIAGCHERVCLPMFCIQWKVQNLQQSIKRGLTCLAKILHLLPFDVMLLQIQIGKPQTRHWPEGNLQGTHGVSWEVGPVDLRRRRGASQQRTTTRRVSRSPGNNHPSHCATQSLDTKVLRHIYHRNNRQKQQLSEFGHYKKTCMVGTTPGHQE